MQEKKHELEAGQVEEAIEQAAGESSAAEAAAEETSNEDKHRGKDEHPDQNFVEVAVVTTAGFFPDEGFMKVPQHQQVRIVLAEADRKLQITDTNGWVARVHSKEIDPAKTYKENGLTGQVEIDFGPREGGGGNA